MEQIEAKTPQEAADNIQQQREAHTQRLIKALITGAKSIDLNVLDEIIDESNQLPFFNMAETDFRVTESLEAVRRFCMELKKIK